MPGRVVRRRRLAPDIRRSASRSARLPRHRPAFLRHLDDRDERPLPGVLERVVDVLPRHPRSAGSPCSRSSVPVRQWATARSDRRCCARRSRASDLSDRSGDCSHEHGLEPECAHRTPDACRTSPGMMPGSRHSLSPGWTVGDGRSTATPSIDALVDADRRLTLSVLSKGCALAPLCRFRASSRTGPQAVADKSRTNDTSAVAQPPPKSTMTRAFALVSRCRRGDLNPHGINLPLAPQASASAIPPLRRGGPRTLQRCC